MQCQLWVEHEPTQVTAKLATTRGKLKSVGEPREASEGFGFLVFAESAAEADPVVLLGGGVREMGRLNWRKA